MRSKRKRRSKRGAEMAHARRRAWARFGVSFTDHDHNQMVEDIRAGKLKLLERQSIRVALYRGALNGSDAVVVYDRKRRSIVSFMTLAMYQGMKDGVFYESWESI